MGDWINWNDLLNYMGGLNIATYIFIGCYVRNNI